MESTVIMSWTSFHSRWQEKAARGHFDGGDYPTTDNLPDRKDE